MSFLGRSDPVSPLINCWHRVFETKPVFVREVLDYALENTRFLTVLVRAIPSLAEHPHPRELTQWLHENENRPLHATTGSTEIDENLPADLSDCVVTLYRFRRMGHRWALLPLSVTVLKPLSARDVDPQPYRFYQKLTSDDVVA